MEKALDRWKRGFQRAFNDAVIAIFAPNFVTFFSVRAEFRPPKTEIRWGRIPAEIVIFVIFMIFLPKKPISNHPYNSHERTVETRVFTDR